VKGRKGRSGLKGQLIDKSIDAYVLALETINRLSIKYRVESFAHLICNAWELLLKARAVDASKSRRVIYYKRKRNEPRRTLSLRDVLSKVIPDNKDAIRRNLETVAELRDEATHYVISEVPREVVLLFQACVINYHKKLTEWFDISLSDRVSVGMMTIVYDLSPETFDPTSASLRRRLGKEVIEYLASYQTKIRQEFEDLNKSHEYSIGIEYKLVLTKKPDEADILLSLGGDGKGAAIVHVAKDPGVTHPHRQKELVAALNTALAGKTKINQHDLKCVNKVYAAKKHAEWFYQGKVAGSPAQYSDAFKNWLLGRFDQDAKFFSKARETAKKK
jgi:hypothetical protein